MKTYWIIELKYLKMNIFFIRIYNENDGKESFIKENEKIKTFKNEELARQYCEKNGFPIVNEVSCFDIDEIQAFINGTIEKVDCELLLDFWNIVSDISSYMDIKFIGDEDGEDNCIYSIYDKLFHGNNLPTINTSGKIYIPNWDEREMLLLKKVIGAGVFILDNCLEIKKNVNCNNIFLFQLFFYE